MHRSIKTNSDLTGTACSSLVLPAYNGLEFTRDFLESWSKFGAGCRELIVVNDASNDGTRDFLDSLNREELQVVHNECNLGYAASANLGASIASGSYLCFLNNDLILTDGWFDPMLEGMQTLPGTGIVGCVQRNPDTDRVDHAGMYFDLDGFPCHAGHEFRGMQGERFVEWRAVTAACFVIRRELFERVGGFDQTYRNGFEDVDLCMRLGQMGYRHYVANKSQIFHHVSQSPGRKLHEKRNAELFLERWGHLTRQFGREEWSREYLRICWNRPKKFRPAKFVMALWLLMRYGGKPSKN